jgi:hypothetical protein
MNIRFVSSLTPDDEDRLGPVVLKAVSAILDQFPIAYTLRLETAAGSVFQHAHAGEDDAEAEPRAPGVAGTFGSVLRARTPLS